MKHERSTTFGSAEAACAGKTAFDSYSAAAKIVSRLRGKPKNKAGRLMIYRCGFCTHWHMGGGVSR